MLRKYRQLLGAILFDLPHFIKHVAFSQQESTRHWSRYGNRNDKLLFLESTKGVKCDWSYTRQLHLCNVFRKTGQWLMAKALQDNPISLFEVPNHYLDGQCFNCDHSKNDTKYKSDKTQVSFIIGHRGLERYPHLLTTLKSIAAQKGISFECIVVEQDNKPQIQDNLPGWVRYVFDDLPLPDMPYSRSAAFNTGAAIAEGDVLIFHDNDMLIPEFYASYINKYLTSGLEVIQPKRFIFYLDEETTLEVFKTSCLSGAQPEYVIENLDGGGSFGITRKAYYEIGGMDEDFVGWGGEDNEFWDRCSTRRVWEHASLPLIHLWHKAQPGKYSISNPTAALLETKMQLSAQERITKLLAKNV
ncbi:MAG: galactosyltransferase-related protein [Lentisphaeria bacterium]|nr:galactosyltransferase-related protein [Lentisphaeria bacterium]